MRGAAQTHRLETLSEWLSASRKTRQLALQPCLDRIRAIEPSVHAWVQVSPQKPTGKGKLWEIPFGVKDLIETKGLSTEYGSPIYAGRLGKIDAAIVREFRRRGAVLLGKTQCAAFAYSEPAATRNPWNLRHTPGGSSSGSAAAVAAGMVPIAIGTQTLGSVVRPASYCGVTGFKASYGLFPMQGVLPLAKSLDTLGFFTDTAADMLRLWECLGRTASRSEKFEMGAVQPLPEVEPAMAAAFRSTLAALSKAGVLIRAVDIGATLSKLWDAANVVMFYEGARFHKARFQRYGSQLGHLAKLVRKGLAIREERYDEARRFIEQCQARFSELYKATPVILSPAATGSAPLGLASTGDPRMNAPWTALGVPAISIPMLVQNGLPLGLQMTAECGQDARLIRAAVRLEELLGE